MVAGFWLLVEFAGVNEHPLIIHHLPVTNHQLMKMAAKAF